MKLSEVIKHRKGFITIDDNKDYKLCRVQVHRKGVVLRGIVKGSEIKTKKQQVCKAGDFLVAEMDAKFGGYGFVPKELDGAIVSSHYFLFELDVKKIRPKYLEVISKLLILQDQIKATGSTNYSAIRPAQVLGWEIPYRDIPSQKEIELLFETTSEKGLTLKTELTNQQDLLTQLRQAFLKEAMQGKLVNQNAKEGNANELLKKITEEKEKLIAGKKLKKETTYPSIKAEEIAFIIPENWVWCRLGMIGICQTGTTPSTIVKDYFGKDIPFIKPADITLKGLITDNEGLSFLGLKEGVLIPTNSLMMVCIGGSIGKSYYTDFNVSCNQQINTITPLAEITAQFLQYFLQSDYFQKAIWAKSSGGTTPIVNRSKWESILIPLPPLAEQKRIVKKLAEVMNLCEELKTTIADNQNYTDMLLQVALKDALQMKEVVTV